MTRQLTGSLISDLGHYKKEWFRGDLIAAFTVTVMLIPQGMAYGLLAGLPAIYGLYAAFVPLLIYPFFGTSKQLSVGPVALVSIMVLSGLSIHAPPGSELFIQLAILTALMAGVIQLLLSLFRMGFLVNFLSEPVISGFTAAAALIIGLSQIKNLLGIDVERARNIQQVFKDLALNIDQTHVPTLILGTCGLLFLLVIRSLRKNFPSALFAAILSTAAVYFFSLDQDGVEILGTVPKGLPHFDFSFLSWEHIPKVAPLALAICLISFIESLAIAKTIAAGHDNYPIDANRELLGLGLGKTIGAFFQAFPSTGSFTRSAINDQGGARTGLSSVFAAAMIGMVLLFLTSLLFYLPKAILAAIIIAAVVGLINLNYAKNLMRLDRKDFYVYLTTFALTLFLGIQEGVFAGIVLSVLMILYKSSKPHYAILGRLPGSDSYRNINRYQDTITTDETLIIRYDDDLYFGNSTHFYDTMISELNKREHAKNLIINCAVISRIDSTGLHYLRLLIERLARRDIRLILVNLRGPVRDLLASCGLEERVGLENYFLSVSDAVRSLEDKDDTTLSQKYAAQKNMRN